jgi:SOS-response transcriptional repressor LexA
LVHSQDDADDNEIVVAGIFGQDDRATVKRLKHRNGKYQLIPESNDPHHYELDWEKEFNKLDGEFKIVGVVEAVFKKKNSNSS